MAFVTKFEFDHLSQQHLERLQRTREELEREIAQVQESSCEKRRFLLSSHSQKAFSQNAHHRALKRRKGHSL